MCVGGWKHPRWNPANINITTVEVKFILCQTIVWEAYQTQLPHRPDPTLPRGGAYTSDHVDVRTHFLSLFF
jgi:phospholipid:diacylglycerol acyltransferase